MPNPEHLAKLKEGLEAWNEWRRVNTEVEPDLSGANLSGADLSGADLSKANLSDADLSRANLSDADLGRANLSHANLSYANLGGADLSGAYLGGATAGGAYLGGATASEADLSRVCRVGGGALARWPPSAAQTARAVVPHAAFTKTHDQRCRVRTTSSGPCLHPSG